MSYSWTEELYLAPSTRMKEASDRRILNGRVNNGVPRNLNSKQKLLRVNCYNDLQIYKQVLITGKQTG